MASPFLPGSYLTIEEYRSAPTALSTNNLVPGKPQQAQDEELAAIIKRASRFIDVTAKQNLFATKAIQNERVRTDRQGSFVLHARQDRVKSLDSFSWGSTPFMLNAVTSPLNPSQYFVEENRILMSPTALGGLSWVGSLNFLATPSNGEFYVSWGYTAGWVTTRLATAAVAGAALLAVEDPTGIRAGDIMQLVEGTQQATVQVDITYQPGSPLVPITAQLADAWTAGTAFTEVPEEIKEAGVLATSHYVKMRKSGGFVMAGAAATVDQATDLQLGPELEQAHQIALRYERRAP